MTSSNLTSDWLPNGGMLANSSLVGVLHIKSWILKVLLICGIDLLSLAAFPHRLAGCGLSDLSAITCSFSTGD
ncbi:MAG: hypothetical protein GWN30_27410 [Gammaproteobacteria bacterium]|nr:hypothetical protein [Gammaproteobacteria bacterium]